jgi:hypothetical protein
VIKGGILCHRFRFSFVFIGKDSFKMEQYYFPFGMPLKKVEQKDRTPKKLFILGVYASAVHARLIDKFGKQKVAALAVASEPEIFWRGYNVEEIISQIHVPEEVGRLEVPTNKSMNGPSGRVLDELYLEPMGLNRNDAWLCDLLPESRVNPGQREAIVNHYTPLVSGLNLPMATIPDFAKSELSSVPRRYEILNELIESQAETIILLGDLPIQWFLRLVSTCPHKKLSEFGFTSDSYGKPIETKINGRSYNVIALCHPRQAGRLGSSSEKWGQLHKHWMQNQISPVF